MSAQEEGDWKARLKALGISRKRGKEKEDLLGKVKRDPRKVESGRRGEDLASLLLEENFLRILDRNVRFKDGELDIVALDGSTTVFVEVKRRAARRWLAAHPSRARSVRFDVVSVLGDPPAVTWIKDAFGADGGA